MKPFYVTAMDHMVWGLLLLCAPIAHGATFQWDAVPGDSDITEGDGTWQDGIGNWYDGALFDQVWSNGNDAVFGGGTAGTAGTVTLGGDVAPNKITFDLPNAGNYLIDLAGNQLTLPNSRAAILGNSDFGTVTLFDSLGTGALVTTGNNFSISLTGGPLTIDAKVTGEGQIATGGAGSLTLTNPNNDFTGILSKQNGGSLSFSSIANVGVASAAGAGSEARVGFNGVLTYTGSGASTDRALTLVGGAGATLANNGSGALIWSGPVTNQSTASKNFILTGTNVDANEIQSALGDTSDNLSLSVRKDGRGLWILSGTNTFSGNIEVRGNGTLRIGASGRLGGDSGFYTGTITLNQNGLFDYSGSSDQSLFSFISGTGRFVQNGPGTLTLGNPNSYSGDTLVNGGALIHNEANTSSTFNVTSGGALYGTGSLGSLTIGGRVSAGSASNMVGNLDVKALTLPSNGRLEVDITSMTGTAGTDWDVITVDGGIVGGYTVTAESGSEFVIELKGAPAFDNSLGYTNIIVKSGTDTGFSARKFRVDTSGLDADLGVGSFTVDTTGDLRLLFFPAGIPTYEWDAGGASDRDWSTSENWTADTAPGSTETAFINNNHTAVVANVGAAVSELVIGGSDAPSTGGNPTGTVEQTGGDLTVESSLILGQNPGDMGTYLLSGGELVLASQESSLSVNSNSQILIDGGTLSHDINAAGGSSFDLGGGGDIKLYGGSLLVTNDLNGTDTVSIRTNVEITNGVFDVDGQVFFTSTEPTDFTVVGDAARVEIDRLNQGASRTNSTFRFIFDADGVSTVKVRAYMNLAGLRLVVDGSGYTGQGGEFILFDSSSFVDIADTNNITVSGFDTNLLAVIVQDQSDGKDDVKLVLTPPFCEVVYEDTEDWSSLLPFEDYCDVLIRFTTIIGLDVDAAAGSLTVNDGIAGFTSVLTIPDHSLTISDPFGGSINLGVGEGAGIVNQSGGSVTADTMNVNASGTGDLSQYNLSDGNVYLSERLTVSSNGVMNLTGGTLVLATHASGLTVNSQLLIDGGTLSHDINAAGGSSFDLGGGGDIKLYGGSLLVTNDLNGTDTVSIRTNVEITNGVFDVDGQVFFTSTEPTDFTVVGDAARVEIDRLNQGASRTNSTFRFIFDADGVSTVEVRAYMNLAGLRLVVDGSGYTGSAGEFILLDSSNFSAPADTNNITVSGFDTNLTPFIIQDQSAGNHNLKLVLLPPGCDVVYDATADWSSQVVEDYCDVTIRGDTTITLDVDDSAASLTLNDGPAGVSSELEVEANALTVFGIFGDGAIHLGAGGGAGVINQSGGSVATADLTVNSSGSGDLSEYNISGGTVSVANSLTVNTNGQILLTGGSMDVAGSFRTVTIANNAQLVIDGGAFTHETVDPGCDVPSEFTFDGEGGIKVYSGELMVTNDLANGCDGILIRSNVEITNGTMVLNGQVGGTPATPRDFTVVGSDATIEFLTLNQSAGRSNLTYNFVFDAEGVSPIYVVSWMDLVDLRAVVDGTVYEGPPGEFILFDSADLSADRAADTNNITITGFTNTALTAQIVQDTNDCQCLKLVLSGTGPATPAVFGNGLLVDNGDTSPKTADNTDFGTVNSEQTHEFLLANMGADPLDIGNLTLMGDTNSFAIARQPSELVLSDEFSGGRVTTDSSRFLESNIDLGWHAPNKGGGSAWTIGGGQLSNSSTNNGPYNSNNTYVVAEGAVVQVVSLSGQGGESVSLSFDYDVPAGDLLYAHLWGYVGAVTNADNFIGNFELGNGAYANNENRTEMDAFNLADGADTGFGAAGSTISGPLTGSGTYATIVNLSVLGIPGVTNAAGLSHLSLAFGRVEDALPGTTRIDNVKIGIATTQLGGGESAIFNVTFNPLDASLASADLQFTNSNVGFSPYSFRVQGQGLPGTPEVYGNGLLINDGDTIPESANKTDFGTVVTNKAHAFTLLNAGLSPIGIGTIMPVSGDTNDFLISRQPSAVVLGDEFEAGSVDITDTRFRKSHIDLGWRAASTGGGSDWGVTNGVLQNSATNNLPYPAYVPAESPVIQAVTLTGQAGTAVMLTFEYDVAPGDQLYAGLVGYDGAFNVDDGDGLLLDLEFEDGEARNFLVGAGEPVPYSLVDGTIPGFGQVLPRFGPLTGSGVYSTNIVVANLLGGSGITDISDLESIALFFGKDEDGLPGVTRIDHVTLEVPLSQLDGGQSTVFEVTFAPQRDGFYSADLEFTNTAAGSLNPYTFRVQGIADLPGTNDAPYDVWAVSFGLTGGEAGLAFDADADAYVNLLEYAFDGNPTNPSDTGFSFSSGVMNPGGPGEFVYARRRDAAARGLTYTVECSTDLIANLWSTDGCVEVGTMDIDADFEYVTVQVDLSAPLTYVRVHIGLQE